MLLSDQGSRGGPWRERRADTKPPDGITQQHIRETRGIRQYRTGIGVAVLAAAAGAAAVGLFGAPDTARSARDDRASLEVFGPQVIRTGEIFEMRFRVAADEDIDEAVISVDEAIWEDITVNTTIPAAVEETHENGTYRFTLGPLTAGSSYLFKADLQINPDHFGGNTGTIGLHDGSELIAELTYELRVLP
ncbi:MAG: hypothetical protein ABR509_00870 [Candidatus Limnocylindria bacterium]